MSSNLHLNFFELKVRRSGSQPSIFVRTFGLFTTGEQKILVNRLKVRTDQAQ